LQPGTRRVTAPLSDPDAKPGQDHLDAVDAGKATCLTLIHTEASVRIPPFFLNKVLKEDGVI